MDVTIILPNKLPAKYGTPQLVDHAKAEGRSKAALLLPPVDVRLNAPGAVDPTEFKKRHGLADNELVIVTVSRLVENMKQESLIRTVEVVGKLGRELPLRLLIVGGGSARETLE